MKCWSTAAAVSLFVALIAISTPASAASTAAGTIGWYDVIEVVGSATPATGGTCPPTPTTYTYKEYYPGPGKTGEMLIAPAPNAGGFNINFQTVTRIKQATPAAGATSWSGTAAYTQYLGASSWDVGTFSFASTLAMVNAYAASAVVTKTITSDSKTPTAVGCKQVLYSTYNYSGK